jgi:anaerobic selenocysteine-containing dehydrogenase/Fe-S-cluster-containing dehydrogenase component
MSELDRRDFLKLVGVGAGSAAASGCSDHVEKLIPYVVQPEEITPGNAVYYASTCAECPASCGLHVRTREGRPVKLEGNPDHPVNRGRLCARGQAGIGRTYHPDRFQGPMKRGGSGELEPIGWDEAIAQVAAEIAKAPRKTQVLGGMTGPTRGALIDDFVAAVGAGGRTVYEPFAQEALREASRAVFGREGVPYFDLSGADFVVDFGSEFLETGLSPIEHAAQLADARDIAAHPHGGARLVTISPRLSMTASNADEWLGARAGSEGILALALARVAIENGAGSEEHRALLNGLLAGFGAASAAKQADVPAESIERLGRALAKARAAVALPPGVALSTRRAIDTTGAVLLLNHVLGAVGTRLQVPLASNGAQPSYRGTLALIQAMAAGNVGVLLVHDANPAYSIPRTAGFAQALEKVGLVVAFASLPDETTARADIVLPIHSPLESWDDAMPRAGVRSLAQPTLRPLYDTRSFGDALLDVGRAVSTAAKAGLPSGSWREVLQAAWSDTDWTAALARGGVFTSAPVGELEAEGEPVTLSPDVARLEVVEPKFTGSGSHALVAFPHGFLYDGRGANLPWLQEIPDNVTKVAWASWAEISPATAESLGVEHGDVIAVETSAGRVEVSAQVRGGIRDDVIAIPQGQGHTVGWWASRADEGASGEARGINVLDSLPAGVDERGGRAWLTEKAVLSRTGRSRRLPTMQTDDNKRGRQLAETISLVALAEAAHAEDHGGGHGDGHGAVHEIREPFDPADDAAPDSEYRWGLDVDLDRCTGCSACVAACYVENNIPVVGEVESLRVRQMAWLRIERFVGEGEPILESGRVRKAPSRERLGDSDVRHSLMMCQQCGSAPCESVCPVIATYHNEEGLNGMIYNRCIGTRYCANNCPYKVRRFNYFDNQINKWPEPMRLMLNPDVTVRGQGVMEKCTYCIQRIQTARQTAKNEGRPIRDGEVVTACQQACPTQAISFGNLRDPESVVSKQSAGKRGYHALHVLNTRPGTTYLAKVDRGKVEG